MATLVLMPKVGITVESCVITKWYKSKGDTVKVGDMLFSYETDKASIDEEAKVDGVILEIIKQEGDDVPCLDGVAVIGTEGEDYSDLIKSSEIIEEPKDEEIKETKEEKQVEILATAEKSDSYKASPRAKAYAKKHGIDLKTVTATGPYGRIVEADVMRAEKEGPVLTSAALSMNADTADINGTGIGGRVTISDLSNNPLSFKESKLPEVEIVKLSNIRKVISKSMMTSLSTTAQLTNNLSFDATSILEYRKALKNTDEALGLNKITINDIILFAVSRALKNHKDLNAHLINDEMHYFKGVHLGIAVDAQRGLLVPTLFNADKMTLAEIANNTKVLINKTKEGTIEPDLLQGASFTISNLGTLGVESFTPVINPPQTGILGVCTTTDKFKIVDGNIKPYKSMGLSLTYDHRAVDGAPAARFLLELKTILENFTAYLAK